MKLGSSSLTARLSHKGDDPRSNEFLEQELEEDLSPPELGEELLRRTRESRISNVPVNSKYRELNNNAKLRRRSSINHDSETSMPAPFGVEDFADIDVGD